MVCRRQDGQRGVLHAFSGEWEGRKTPPGWVPSAGFCPNTKQNETEQSRSDNFTQRIAELKEELPGTRHCDDRLKSLKSNVELYRVR